MRFFISLGFLLAGLMAFPAAGLELRNIDDQPHTVAIQLTGGEIVEVEVAPYELKRITVSGRVKMRILTGDHRNTVTGVSDVEEYAIYPGGQLSLQRYNNFRRDNI
jgi:hypothetical protein